MLCVCVNTYKENARRVEDTRTRTHTGRRAAREAGRAEAGAHF